jgi:hypothetical protein
MTARPVGSHVMLDLRHHERNPLEPSGGLRSAVPRIRHLVIDPAPAARSVDIPRPGRQPRKAAVRRFLGQQTKEDTLLAVENDQLRVLCAGTGSTQTCRTPEPGRLEDPTREAGFHER